MESIRVLSTSNTEANASQVLLFPNPASNKFTITRRGTTALTVVINDMLGKIVYQNTVNSNVLEIENNDRFKSGLYMVKITDDKQGVSYTKLVIR
jgi:C4-type Zn-finger protein